MQLVGIRFILVYVDEAHSTEWPLGLDPVEPQRTMGDRIARARTFASQHDIGHFEVVADSWSNTFAETFHAWPDKYFHFNTNLTLLACSQYGSVADAVVDVDCVDVIQALLKGS